MAAVACLVHCAGLPLAFAILPAAASLVPIPAYFHIVAFALAVPATGGALFAGYRQHRLRGPLIAGSVGLLLLALGALWWEATPLEVPITILGSLFIAAAHVLNWRLRRSALHPLG